MSSQFVPFADYPSVSDKHGTGTVTATDILATAATSGFQLLIRGSALVFCRPKRPAGWIKIAGHGVYSYGLGGVRLLSLAQRIAQVSS